MAVREILLSYGADLGKSNESARTNLRTPATAAVLMAPLLEREVCEVGYVLCLTAKMDLIGYHQVSRGTVNATPMYAREVFKAAVLTNAAGIIVVHNHPSGDPSPSVDDDLLTSRVKAAGEILGIDVFDHIIIGHSGQYTSIREQGRF